MSNPGPNITSTPITTDIAEVAPTASAAGDGHFVGKAPTSKVGFWGAQPTAQFASPAGNVHTPTVGAGATVHVDTTFDGSIGTTAYTIGDIVAALKTIGILG